MQEVEVFMNSLAEQVKRVIEAGLIEQITDASEVTPPIQGDNVLCGALSLERSKIGQDDYAEEIAERIRYMIENALESRRATGATVLHVGLVENGGGTIAVESQAGVGTTFTVSFPV